MMKKRATIKDVAALAGVSFSTVSRVLDDSPQISAATKERVRSACERLGYSPNAAARGLVGQDMHTLGLLVRNISNPYSADMATAIEECAAEHGYRVLLSNSMRDPEQELRAIDNFLSRQIDGILISADSPQSQVRHRAILGDLPCVYLGINHDDDCSYVMADNEMGAYQATRYLLDLGHRDILFLGGRTISRAREFRIQGYLRALGERGIEGREFPAPAGVPQMRQWSYEQSLKIFSGPLPDAIFVYNDINALKVMEAAEACGIRIPEDVSLMGYDNIAFASLPRIHLTTVSQHKFSQGRIAVERLLEKIQGATEKTVDILEPELMIRSTCKEK